jgi:hypothetical protein
MYYTYKDEIFIPSPVSPPPLSISSIPFDIPFVLIFPSLPLAVQPSSSEIYIFDSVNNSGESSTLQLFNDCKESKAWQGLAKAKYNHVLVE